MAAGASDATGTSVRPRGGRRRGAAAVGDAGRACGSLRHRTVHAGGENVFLRVLFCFRSVVNRLERDKCQATLVTCFVDFD